MRQTDRQLSYLRLNKLSISVTPTCDSAGWDLAWQPHPSLSLPREASSDGRLMTGAIEPPTLSVGASSQLRPPRALKGSVSRGLIAARWMQGDEARRLFHYLQSQLSFIVFMHRARCVFRSARLRKSLFSLTLQVRCTNTSRGEIKREVWSILR